MGRKHKLYDRRIIAWYSKAEAGHELCPVRLIRDTVGLFERVNVCFKIHSLDTNFHYYISIKTEVVRSSSFSAKKKMFSTSFYLAEM